MRVLELRSVASRRHEPKRQRPRHSLLKPLSNQLRIHARCKHQAQVSQDGQAAQLPLAQEPFEVLALVLPSGQGNLPSVGRLERVLNELLPNSFLLGILRLRVAEKQHVAQRHPTGRELYFASW